MNPAQIDLNLLVALDALLTERNVSRAGARIDLSQPAMSSALRRLRALFGDELLVRAGREYQLTPLARGLVDPVREILRLVELTMEYRPAFNPAVDRHVFRIAASENAEYMLVRPLLQRIAREAPGVSIEIQSLAARKTIEMIESGDLDCGLWGYGIFETNLIQEPLYRDELIVAVGDDNCDVGETLTLEQLEQLPAGTFSWSWYDRSGLSEPPVHSLEQSPVRAANERCLMRLFHLRGTGMMTFARRRFAESVAAAAGIRIVKSPIPFEPQVEAMLWHPRQADDPAHRWLRTQLVEIGAALDGRDREHEDNESSMERPPALAASVLA